MRLDQIEEVLSTLDDVFRQLGVNGGFTEAVSAVQSATSDPADPVASIAMIVAGHLLRETAETALSTLNLRHVQTRTELEEMLVAAPDLTPDDLRLLDELKKIPTCLRQSLKTVTREVKPKGGHPVLVPRAEYRTICDEIALFHRSGLKLGEAKRKLATKWDCSISKINQIWASRKTE